MLERAHPEARYLGLDQSPRMCRLAESKLAQNFNECAKIRNVDATERIPDDDVQVRSVLMFYVLDLMSDTDARKVLANCAGLCSPDSRLCAVSITEGLPSSWLSRAVMGTWSRIAGVAPLLLGGCRPQRLKGLLESAGWVVLETEFYEVAGYTSVVCCAAPPSFIADE